MPPSANSDENALLPLRAITVEGFKSIDHEQTIELRPLTILAGANSSGKSSMIQPLLLIKQTLEAPYDPGPLLLNGANAKFTFVEQFLNKSRIDWKNDEFAFGFAFNSEYSYKLHFRRPNHEPIELEKVSLLHGGRFSEFKPGEAALRESPFQGWLPQDFASSHASSAKVRIHRNRCFLEGSLILNNNPNPFQTLSIGLGFDPFERAITQTIHVPGLRGNPRRNYPLTAVGERFPGTFEDYVASVIAAQKGDPRGILARISADLVTLGLTWTVEARAVDDTQVELLVGRLPQASRNGSRDLVSIADVGFGVSQTLPVVVALQIAQPGQIVYIEQPEIHLHPRAQHAMARLLGSAAKRGVQVITETHSSLLLLGVQSLIAAGELDPGLVKLHWFKREPATGITHITSNDLDQAGRFGDWPVDFDNVSLEAQMAYLNAAEQQVAGHE